ncbi:long-chain fatty acid--CoA ligase [Streptomyces clavuligerus]|uniref:acyl-CoA synthetase n=2 Tax=Streptomyces clavuligerus TaxID=1901 RepID=UPI00017FFE77|nr:long-chain fatty acid--CoA ligase [Streptomyces clavuligerus]ANW16945.1 AMP-dependent synthetase [Streptomyces clavuligerus]AXU11474.1 long-chain-fatty-acid--CoA ligase [Streptomyces clavuligerus]EDY50755.1 feruloyl-CoA synthetase [Streptomyces clavuligerus]MBY6301293.1 long-chain fatty acid--CoA ligase [Streptomyces clavuligerus]QCS04346.1 p-hydroxycinnamoyl-CoA synthetase [Streptomyces clavuligerus]
MRDQGIGSWIRRRARKTPHRCAVVHRDLRYTYAQWDERTTRLAHHLRGLGVRRGDRVGFLGANHPALLETLFAAGQLGAVLVPLNTRLAAPELRHCLTDSGTSLLVHAPAFDAFARDCPVGRTVPVDDTYEDALARADGTPLDESVSRDDNAVIMYTSGTTGRAKGVVLSHGNITWNSVNVLVDADLASDEVTLLSAPLFHTAALNMTCLPVLLKGGTLVLEESFSPTRTLDLIEEHGVTLMFGVPAMFQQIAAAERFDAADLSSVRTMLCGGAPVPPALIRLYKDRGLRFLQGYGLTEASPGVCLLDAENALTKAGSAGLPHFFNDIRIVDRAGDDVERGERGELLVEGPTVTSGYWGPSEENEAAFADGWLHSGDVVTQDEDGYVTVVDRAKDMIISGGENISPVEVEKALFEHPAVADCAVIGVPDATWGEVGCAVIVRTPGAGATGEEILAFLDGRLARYKIPHAVVLTDALPRNSTGKVAKHRLREICATTAPPRPGAAPNTGRAVEPDDPGGPAR